MTNLQKAKVILSALEEYVKIDEPLQDFWVAGILQGLANIRDEENMREVDTDEPVPGVSPT